MKSFSFERLFAPRLPDLRAALDELARRSLQAGASQRDVDDFVLSVNEAVVNAIEHGCQARPHCFVSLRCGVDVGQRLWAQVRDQGDGFDPDAVPDPTSAERRLLPEGRGLLMIRELCDEVTWHRDGREIRLVKYLAVRDER